jgi:hypothetical protein
MRQLKSSDYLRVFTLLVFGISGCKLADGPTADKGVAPAKPVSGEQAMALAATSNREAEKELVGLAPEEVVRRYLDLDKSGAYLTEGGRIEIARLTDGPPESNQVVFTTHIIRSYRIVASKIKGDSAEVSVEYDNVGFVEEQFYKFTAQPMPTRFGFELKKNIGGVWFVSEFPAPNMSVETVIQHLEKIASTAHNPKYFRDLVRQVREAAKPPKK